MDRWVQRLDTDIVRVACDVYGIPTTQNLNGPFTCLSCHQPLVYRRPHHRTRYGPNQSTTFHVRGHFAHTSSSCGESWVHCAAKALLVQYPEHPLLSFCGGCDRKQPFKAIPDGKRVAEYKMGNGRVVDIAILSSDTDVVVGVIEIHHTHACDDEKLLELCDIVGSAWCEVKARDVIDAFVNDVPVHVAVHAAEVCTVCHAASRKHISTTKAQLLQERQHIEDMKQTTAELQALLEARIEAEQTHRREIQRKRLLEAGGETILDFGKYKGIALEALVQEDVSYIAWLSKGVGGDISCIIPSHIILKSRELLSGVCHECGDAVEGPKWKKLCKECWSAKR